ncbi:glycosyltransferase family 4 protein [Bacillus sp. DNRA2]|uniref:glycosyltransferase family 4 protein n=1 Tax=Bacillus sp. DNRA2 TaxID=2723053 RepID=UPI00145C5723|nr:glycosyltransferase family 4 protein [Bacillus sp. DNRA2]NMD70865.1 glycosyltransferase family 4 protein [Bacillus sp. DNRA2]
MRKILYITTVSDTINSFLVPHIEKLKLEGNVVDCACFIDEEIDPKLPRLGVLVYNVPFTRNPLDPINYKAFKQLIKIQEEYCYDIVHVHTPIAALYGRLLKLKFPQLKTIYTVHGFHFYKGASLVNWSLYYPIEKLMAHFTDTIITINSEDHKQAKKLKCKETLFVNGVGVNLSVYNKDLFDRNQVRRKLGLDVDDFVLIMIAEVNKNKNHLQMIETVQLLKRRGIEVKVICAGGGPLLKELKQEVVERNLDNNILFLGSRTDVNQLIVASDLGILVSYREGLPRNIMEIMACQKTMIGTNIRGIRDLIDDGVTGFLVNIGDSKATAARIEELFHHREKLRQMGANAYDSIKKYDVSTVMKSMERVYR